MRRFCAFDVERSVSLSSFLKSAFKILPFLTNLDHIRLRYHIRAVGDTDSRVLTHCDKEPLFLSQTIAKVLTIVPVDKNPRTRFRHSVKLPRLELTRSKK